MASIKVCNTLRDLARSYNNTSFYNDGMTDGILLRGILIFKIDKGRRIITLDTGGRNTPTTRRRINEAFIASGLAGWFVYQNKGELYFSKSYDNPDKNGYVFEYKISIAY